MTNLEFPRPLGAYACLLAMVALTLCGQIATKWQVSKAGGMPSALSAKVMFLLNLAFNPWVMGAFFAAFLASLFWMAALTKLPLNVAYPFTSLTFIGVLVVSAVVFHEPVHPAKFVGVLFLVLGVVLCSQSW
ncbi:MAG TPA: EamA family transporter [Oscillatoriaceae cyanobacterium]